MPSITPAALALADAVLAVAPAARFLHVSTIAAREPQLSDYAGSKRAGEDTVLERLGTRATVLRPPAVYGPGDRESLVFFQMASKRLVPLAGTPQARAAMIHVDDLHRVAGGAAARGAARCGAHRGRCATYRPLLARGAAPGREGGGQSRAQSCSTRLRHCCMPSRWAATWARLFSAASMLNHQKLRELRHADWSVSMEEWARPAGWQPRYPLSDGFGHAVAWYRRAGWL